MTFIHPYAIRIVPSRMAELGFKALVPADWVEPELPDEEPDFSVPTVLCPLKVIAAPHAPIFMTFAARPAFSDGTVRDHANYLISHQGFERVALERGQIGDQTGIVGTAEQSSEIGRMLIRFGFFEDGGRLVNVSLIGPEAHVASLDEVWRLLTGSFTLDDRRGPTAYVETEDIPEVRVEVPPVVIEDDDEDDPSRPKESFRDFATAPDFASVAPDHPVNLRAASDGLGAVPEIWTTDDDIRRVTMEAPSIFGRVEIPYGWHLVDDGARVLVFSTESSIRIEFRVVEKNGLANDRMLDDLFERTRADEPTCEASRMSIDGVEFLEIRDDRSKDHFCAVVDGYDDRSAILARGETRREESVDARTLAVLIARGLAFIPDSEREEIMAAKKAGKKVKKKTAKPEMPEWWTKATELEAAGKLKQAEATIQREVQDLGRDASIAEMYRLRMVRLKEAGDRAGAEEAFQKADGWMSSYASGATSGGEGMALSQERDDFRRTLVRQLGYDPDRS